MPGKWTPSAPFPADVLAGARVVALCLAEARPSVLAVSSLRYLTGVALALPITSLAEPARVLQGGLAWVLSIFAIYLFNGVTDITEDRINGSGRPIARGGLSPGTATAVAAGAAVLALVATVGLPGPMSWIIAVNLGLGYLYSGPPAALKGSSGGTVAVLVLSGLLSYLAGFTVATADTGGVAPTGLIVFAATATCWMVMVGVPAKDLSDIPGDAAAGRRTVGVLLGERVSSRLMMVAALTLLAAFCVAVVIWEARLAGVLAAMAAGVTAVVAAGTRVRVRAAEQERGARRRPYKTFMATQHLVHITAVLSNI
ncbi:UbiA family prenyltransferase [Nonomuraea glycinis]|uniref:Homogentisate phytyltransferase n=1 Tax=Nonomuraea glycinis TaxID=2047744 RepID=A0A918EA11_9ACTN|nr:UbiA family prenyltransferase [Nonomuraea glycinis]MCA2183142.1 UbiA family prenyltransferase [Nonomuraea glycinis]GGP17826.1 homogentisate phytyltransferase [Nonomuraea glycinis]